MNGALIGTDAGAGVNRGSKIPENGVHPLSVRAVV